MKYRGFLFDLDGTLLDTEDLIVDCFRHSLNYAAGIKKNDEEIKKLIGRPLIEMLKIHLNHGDYDYKAIAQEHMNYQYLHWKEKLKVFDGVLDLLKNIVSNGGINYIVTSRLIHSAVLYSQALGIRDYVDVIITPDFVEKPKPAPDSALFAMKVGGFSKEESLFIGDSAFDIQCAHGAGIDSVFVTWGTGNVEALPVKPTFVAHSPEELWNLLKTT